MATYLECIRSVQDQAQDARSLEQVFRNEINPNSCPYHYNFHMHTTYSDGKLTPVELIQQAVNIGLKGLAITDHHSIDGYAIAVKWLEESNLTTKPHLWTGMEITSSLLGAEIHILGFAFDPSHPSLSKYLLGKSPEGTDGEPARVIDAIHEAKGIAVLAHPSRYKVSAKELVPLIKSYGIDGIETYYAYGNPNPWQASPAETKLAEELSGEYGLLNTCGTDTHGVNLLMRI